MTDWASSKTPFSRLVVAGLAAITAAVAANLVLLLVLRPLLRLNPAFAPFSAGSVMFFTALFTCIGWLVYLVVNRVTRRPRRVFLVIAVVALLISLLPNLGGLANPASVPIPGSVGAPRDFGVLILFHLAGFAVYMAVLYKMLGSSPSAAERR